jgi:hypothetical protein
VKEDKIKTPRDPHSRRRAFQVIALLYGAAALANLCCWLRP